MAAAFEKPVLHIEKLATSTLATSQYKGVKLSSGGLVICSVAGEFCNGILQNAPAAAATGVAMTKGITKAVAGGTIAENARVAVDANGDLVTATGGKYAIGTALESAVDNDVFTVELGAQAGYVATWSYSIHCQLVKITATSAEVLTDLIPGIPALKIERFTTVVTVVASTSGKDADFYLVKNTATAMTGTKTLLTADITPIGKMYSQAITDNAASLLNATDTLSLYSPEVAAAFAEGQVQFTIYGRIGG